MTTDKTVKKQQKLRGKPFEKGVSGNPNGRPKGSVNFNTAFDNAVLKLNKNGSISDLEEKLITVAIKGAQKGDYRYWSALMERRFGKVKDIKQIETGPETKMVLLFSEEELRKIK
jgi:Family of unknown function (DUF5681)